MKVFFIMLWLFLLLALKLKFFDTSTAIVEISEGFASDSDDYSSDGPDFQSLRRNISKGINNRMVDEKPLLPPPILQTVESEVDQTSFKIDVPIPNVKLKPFRWKKMTTKELSKARFFKYITAPTEFDPSLLEDYFFETKTPLTSSLNLEQSSKTSFSAFLSVFY